MTIATPPGRSYSTLHCATSKKGGTQRITGYKMAEEYNGCAIRRPPPAPLRSLPQEYAENVDTNTDAEARLLAIADVWHVHHTPLLPSRTLNAIRGSISTLCRYDARRRARPLHHRSKSRLCPRYCAHAKDPKTVTHSSIGWRRPAAVRGPQPVVDQKSNGHIER